MRAYRGLRTVAAAFVAAIGIIAGGAALGSGSTANATEAPVSLAQTQQVGADCTECACLTVDDPAPTTPVPTSPNPSTPAPTTAAPETSGPDVPESDTPPPTLSGAVDALVPAAMVVPAAARAMDPPKGGNSYSITVTQAADPKNPDAGKAWKVTRNVCKVKADLKVDEKNHTTVTWNGPDKFGKASFYQDVKVEITFSDFDAAKCSDPNITFLGGFAAQGPLAYRAWSTEDGKYVVHMSFHFEKDNSESFFDLYRAGFVVSFTCVP